MRHLDLILAGLITSALVFFGLRADHLRWVALHTPEPTPATRLVRLATAPPAAPPTIQVAPTRRLRRVRAERRLRSTRRYRRRVASRNRSHTTITRRRAPRSSLAEALDSVA